MRRVTTRNGSRLLLSRSIFWTNSR